jgi:hypothetical protein
MRRSSICRRTGKVIYGKNDAMKAALEDVTRHGRSPEPARSYKCRYCWGWHITRG